MKRILVVEDDSTTRALLRATLRLGSYEVTEAVDGGQAIEQLSQAHVDLVLLDIMLPTRSGYEVLEWMQQQDGLRDVPVVVVSATDQASGLVREALGGAIAHVTKPFGYDDVMSVIEHALSLSPDELREQRDRLIAAAQTYEIEPEPTSKRGILGRFRRRS